MTTASRRPGMADVARAAGVSHQTVSRVLNHPDAVAPGTRERVLSAITELGYRRNMGARALATSRSRLIGVIVDQGGYYGPGQTSSSIQMAARQNGYATLVAAIRDTSQAEIQQVLDLFLDHRVDGVIVIAPQVQLMDRLAQLADEVPLVLVADGIEPAAGVLTVSVDQHAAAMLATNHLIQLGHRQIVHVRGPVTWFDALERERGWRDAMMAAGLPLPAVLDGDWSPESGHRAGVRLLETGLPEAVVAANDQMALGLMSALHDAGVSVPGQVSVVGHDDGPGAAYYQPPLTSVRQPFEKLGEACVEALLSLITDVPIQPIRVAPELKVRVSTAPRLD